MPSTSLKRTAATLGVVAGLLATAGPASAMPIYMKYDDVAVVGAQFRGEVTGLEPMMKSAASGSNSLALENTMISGYSVTAAAAGTQVGSEGRKPQSTYDQASPF
jgi:hypothetical protein